LEGESRKPVLIKTKKLVKLKGVFMDVMIGRKYRRKELIFEVVENSRVEVSGLKVTCE
jgi:hypothetical protein